MAEDKIKKLIKEIEKLSVLELNQLVKALEKKFGVQVGAMPAPAAGPTAGPAEEEKKEEKAIVDLILKSGGENKINVIKAVRQIKPDLGLKEAKDLVDAAATGSQVVKENVKKEEAEDLKKKFEAAGAKVELK